MKPLIARRPSPLRPPGLHEDSRLGLLQLGARLLQDRSPLKGFDAYVVGFHCPKDERGEPVEAHHYCRIVNDDLMQCVLFDGNTRRANLIGVEYVVSERLHAGLPGHERRYWHPHNFEVLSGQLVAPGLPAVAEKALLKRLLNSYGKTWHTWQTGRHDGGPGHQLPFGDARLMWSFNHDGECDEALKEHRNCAMRIDEVSRRAQRRPLARYAHVQDGVDARKDAVGTG